jgi:hypothetical protein
MFNKKFLMTVLIKRLGDSKNRLRTCDIRTNSS